MKKVELSPESVSVPQSVVEYYIETEEILKRPQEVLRERNCVFCNIAHGDDQKSDMLYKDDNFVAFRNITPAATHHYLIVPKGHIESAMDLKAHHIPMLEQMEAIANDVLTQQGGRSKSYRIGYHWPPFISVRHLHLHIIAPVEELSVRAKFIFQPATKWFRSTQEVISRIKAKSLKSSL